MYPLSSTLIIQIDFLGHVGLLNNFTVINLVSSRKHLIRAFRSRPGADCRLNCDLLRKLGCTLPHPQIARLRQICRSSDYCGMRIRGQPMIVPEERLAILRLIDQTPCASSAGAHCDTVLGAETRQLSASPQVHVVYKYCVSIRYIIQQQLC